MIIRKAKSDDMANLVDMGRRYFDYSGFGEFSTFEPERTASVFGSAIANDGQLTPGVSTTLFIAETEEKEPAGFAMFTYGPALFDSKCITCQEMYLWVEDKHRKNGLGTKFLERGARWGKENGAGVFMVGAHQGYEMANELFRKLGFREYGRNYLREI